MHIDISVILLREINKQAYENTIKVVERVTRPLALLILKFLTFNESKQAITLPFSTWQLLGGWANLHSSSLREQVPLWNCRHTSRVSHFVSRIEAMFRAMSATLAVVLRWSGATCF